MGNLSESALDDINDLDEGDLEDIDCNSCDIVVDDVETATYINPAYAHMSEEAEQQRSEETRTSTTVEATATATESPTSRARIRVEGRGPLQTAAAEGPEGLRKYLYGV